ncbi:MULTISPECIES: cupin domain-containing protein [Hydrotalea]|uniref:cupin domain-containing protein n=2 Tax=Chitinophagaceae TaxID=563835 RepID=UPI0009437A08|nr:MULTISPECIES: cupin domain-containing protein [Hydrotalea]RWZ87594.1 MAG: cupin domain-containing protein [Hydrotalea sp. AMD]
MKKFTLILFIIIFSTRHTVKAQDLCSYNPKYCKLLSDTAGIKMMLITLPPGAKLSEHTHPINMGYVIKGSLYKWEYTTGKMESANMKPGDSFYGGPETPHHSWNAGKSVLQFILIEKQK